MPAAGFACGRARKGHHAPVDWARGCLTLSSRPGMPEDENGEAMPRRLCCLTMPPAQLPHEGCSWASAMLSFEDLNMNAAMRHAGQAMHEANDLLPPVMHPWPFS